MQFRTDTKSGNQLSVLGFGCMRFPRNRLGAIDMQKTEWLIMEAINAGVNYFDTAYIYGGSEDALGTILEKNKARDKVYIATKLPLVFLKGPADFEKYFTRELERLRTDHIDYYLMHMLTDMDMWEKLKSWGIEEWIARKKESGQIRQIGFSFHGSQDEFLRLLEVYPWEFVQIQYNYTGENFQAGKVGFEKAAALGIPVIIMEPLLGGRLASPPPSAAAIFKKADSNRTPADWALRWVWDHPAVTLLLSGMNDPKQLEENIAIANTADPETLTSDAREVYRQVLEVFNSSYKVRCTGCNYCMPCPRNVNIPGCFAAYNTSFALGWMQGMQQYATSATLTSAQSGSAGNCVKCGKCEQHCPQHLPIIKSLEQVQGRMEPLPVRWGIGLVRAVLGRKKAKGRD
ncbi:aldo/keto reductase [Spirochaetia bacterium]|nr:aldo/keto reductase [Spirochaetia bacterium]